MASTLTVVTATREPLKVIGDMDVHATAWILLATVAFSLCGASMTPIIDRWLFAPRRERIDRFRQLKPRVDAIIENLYRGIRDRPHRTRPEQSNRDENIELQRLESELDVRLRAIGVGPIPLDVEKYSVLADMMERGALREAPKRFPVPRTSRWCRTQAGAMTA